MTAVPSTSAHTARQGSTTDTLAAAGDKGSGDVRPDATSTFPTVSAKRANKSNAGPPTMGDGGEPVAAPSTVQGGGRRSTGPRRKDGSASHFGTSGEGAPTAGSSAPNTPASHSGPSGNNNMYGYSGSHPNAKVAPAGGNPASTGGGYPPPSQPMPYPHHGYGPNNWGYQNHPSGYPVGGNNPPHPSSSYYPPNHAMGWGQGRPMHPQGQPSGPNNNSANYMDPNAAAASAAYQYHQYYQMYYNQQAGAARNRYPVPHGSAPGNAMPLPPSGPVGSAPPGGPSSRMGPVPSGGPNSRGPSYQPYYQRHPNSGYGANSVVVGHGGQPPMGNPADGNVRGATLTASTGMTGGASHASHVAKQQPPGNGGSYYHCAYDPLGYVLCNTPSSRQPSASYQQRYPTSMQQKMYPPYASGGGAYNTTHPYHQAASSGVAPNAMMHQAYRGGTNAPGGGSGARGYPAGTSSSRTHLPHPSSSLSSSVARSGRDALPEHEETDEVLGGSLHSADARKGLCAQAEAASEDNRATTHLADGRSHVPSEDAASEGSSGKMSREVSASDGRAHSRRTGSSSASETSFPRPNPASSPLARQLVLHQHHVIHRRAPTTQDPNLQSPNHHMVATISAFPQDHSPDAVASHRTPVSASPVQSPLGLTHPGPARHPTNTAVANYAPADGVPTPQLRIGPLHPQQLQLGAPNQIARGGYVSQHTPPMSPARLGVAMGPSPANMSLPAGNNYGNPAPMPHNPVAPNPALRNGGPLPSRSPPPPPPPGLNAPAMGAAGPPRMAPLPGHRVPPRRCSDNIPTAAPPFPSPGGYRGAFPLPVSLYEHHPSAQEVWVEDLDAGMMLDPSTAGNFACLLDAFSPVVPVALEIEAPLTTDMQPPSPTAAAGRHAPTLAGPMDFDGPFFTEPITTLASVWSSFAFPFGCTIRLAQEVCLARMRSPDDLVVYAPLLSGFRIQFVPSSASFAEMEAVREKQSGGRSPSQSDGGCGGSEEGGRDARIVPGLLTWSASERPDNRNVMGEQLHALAAADPSFGVLLTGTTAEIDHQSWIAVLWQPVFCGNHSAKQSCGSFLVYYLLRPPRQVFLPYADRSHGAALNSNWNCPVFRVDRMAVSMDVWRLTRDYRRYRRAGGAGGASALGGPQLSGSQLPSQPLQEEDGARASIASSHTNHATGDARSTTYLSPSSLGEASSVAVPLLHNTVRLAIVGCIPNRCRSDVWLLPSDDGRHDHASAWTYRAALYLLVTALQLMTWNASEEHTHQQRSRSVAVQPDGELGVATTAVSAAKAPEAAPALTPSDAALGASALSRIVRNTLDANSHFQFDVPDEVLNQDVTGLRTAQQTATASSVGVQHSLEDIKKAKPTTNSSPSASAPPTPRAVTAGARRGESVPAAPYFRKGMLLLTEGAQRYRQLRGCIDESMEAQATGKGSGTSDDDLDALPLVVAGGTNTARCGARGGVIVGLLDFYQWAQYDTALLDLAESYCCL